MLVLSRKAGETVTVKLPDGREMIIGISAIFHNRCRVAIRAPKDVTIFRTELLEEAQKPCQKS